MRLFPAPLDTCLDSPFFASLSVHDLHFTVYAPSIIGFFLAQTIFFATLHAPSPGLFSATEQRQFTVGLASLGSLSIV